LLLGISDVSGGVIAWENRSGRHGQRALDALSSMISSLARRPTIAANVIPGCIAQTWPTAQTRTQLAEEFVDTLKAYYRDPWTRFSE
jgi:hypothetical protein